MISWRDVVRDWLPPTITESVAFEIGATLGDDARACGLSMWPSSLLAALIGFWTLQLAKALAATGSIGHSATARREVLRLVTAALKNSGACRPMAC